MRGQCRATSRMRAAHTPERNTVSCRKAACTSTLWPLMNLATPYRNASHVRAATPESLPDCYFSMKLPPIGWNVTTNGTVDCHSRPIRRPRRGLENPGQASPCDTGGGLILSTTLFEGGSCPRCSQSFPPWGLNSWAGGAKAVVPLEVPTHGETLPLLAGVGNGAGVGSDGSIAAISCIEYRRRCSRSSPLVSLTISIA